MGPRITIELDPRTNDPTIELPDGLPMVAIYGMLMSGMEAALRKSLASTPVEITRATSLHVPR